MAGEPCPELSCTGFILDDGFCDTCGASGAARPAPASTSSAAPTNPAPLLTNAGEAGEVCPECGVARDDGGAFCEACGHPFNEGSERPASPVFAVSTAPAPTAPGSAAPGSMAPGSMAAGSANEASAGGAGGVSGPSVAPAASSSIPSVATWDAVIATDADWFASFARTWEKNGQGPCPISFPGAHERTMALPGRVVLIGRHADGIDLAEDPDDLAVSRHQASLTDQGDGTWLVSDLGSSNGTYIGDKRLGLGGAQAVGDGGTIHVGAFTRITLKRRPS